MAVFDFHLHLEPLSMLRPVVRRMYQSNRPDLERIQSYIEDPIRFLKYLDSQQVEKACIISYVSQVLGTGPEINDFVSRYRQTCPDRLFAFGSVHPVDCPDVEKELSRVIGGLGLCGIKLHPPHQGFFANAYRHGLNGLQQIYQFCEDEGVPVMIHTGTSIFPDARNLYADPLPCDDVAVDFPRLKLVVAHGGRPLWMNTAHFLVRRHANLWLDISSIPPQSLLEYFPKLHQISERTLFGSDWPGPGVPDIGINVERMRALCLPEATCEDILYRNALRLLEMD